LSQEEQFLNNALEDILLKMTGFLENTVKPVFVFSQSAVDAMATEVNMDKFKFTSDRAEQTSCIPFSFYKDFKVLLTHFGIPVIETNNNLHEEISRVAKNENSFAVVSEDLLFLAFGTPYLLRYVDATKNLMRQISLDQILRQLDLSFEQFIDLWIILGSDYSKHFKYLKPGKAFTHIKTYKTIEEVIRVLKEGLSEEALKTLDSYDFSKPRTIIKLNIEDKETQVEPAVVWKKLNSDDLLEFLVGNKSFTETTVYNSLTKISNQSTKAIQKRISSFKI